MLFDRSGREVFRVRSRDFADRISDHDLLDAARSLGSPALDLGVAAPQPEPDEHKGALRVDAFGPYFRGIASGTRALAGRMIHEEDRDEALAMSTIATSFLAAWKERRASASLGG